MNVKEFSDPVQLIKVNGVILKYQYSGPIDKLKLDAKANKAAGDCDNYRILPTTSSTGSRAAVRFYTHDLYQR